MDALIVVCWLDVRSRFLNQASVFVCDRLKLLFQTSGDTPSHIANILNINPRQSDCERRLSAWEWLVIVVGSAALFASTVNAKPLQSANDRSRWSTVWSLVHRGSYVIDDIDAHPAWQTIDKVKHDGHFYSTKPPLLATTAAGIYWVVHNSTGLDLSNDTARTARIILLFLNWLPTTIAFVVMGRLLLKCSTSQFVRAIALSVFCLGSLVPSYATTLNNHSTATVCLVFSISFLFRIVVDPQRQQNGEQGNSTGSGTRVSDPVSGLTFMWAGFWAALVPCNELPAALFGIAAFWLAWRSSKQLTLKWFILGALIPLGVYFALNWIATGGWKPFYMYYGTEKYRYVHEGIPSYWMNPRGIDQSIDSPPVYFLHCVIGHHGIFSLSPIFVLLFCTLKRRLHWKTAAVRDFIWLGFGLSVLVLSFYLTRTSNYNYGGNTYGLRWMLWLTPFWVLALVPALEWCVESRRRLVTMFVLLGVSVGSSMSAAQAPWSESWLFTQMRNADWIDYSSPAPNFPFKRSLHTWFSDIPQTQESGAWVEFTSSGPVSDPLGREPDKLRITDQGAVEKNGRETRQVEFRLTPGAGEVTSIVVWFDLSAFYAGESVGKSIVGFRSSGDHDVQQIFTLVRGIPSRRAYRPGVTRYVKTALQDDHFACQRAATQVREERNGELIMFRSNLWLSGDVPFGVVQFEWSEHEVQTNHPLSVRRYVVSAMGNRVSR